MLRYWQAIFPELRVPIGTCLGKDNRSNCLAFDENSNGILADLTELQPSVIACFLKMKVF